MPTKIGRGTKLDNVVHIGHNVVIGEDCLVCGQVGIAGLIQNFLSKAILQPNGDVGRGVFMPECLSLPAQLLDESAASDKRKSVS